MPGAPMKNYEGFFQRNLRVGERTLLCTLAFVAFSFVVAFMFVFDT